jgi:hypothetical protein
MMRRCQFAESLAACAILFAMGAGCRTTPPPWKDPSYKPKRLEEIAIMPVVDIRKDKTSADLDLADVQAKVAWWVDWQGYSSRVVKPGGGDFGGLQPGEIARLEPARLAEIVPPDAKRAMYFFVEDASYTNGVVYKSCRFEARALLVDRQAGALLWRNKYAEATGVTAGGLVTLGLIGLIAVAIVPAQSSTMNECIHTLTASLPEFKEE